MIRHMDKLLLLSFIPLSVCQVLADDWPQWRGPTRDGVWRETGLVEKFAEEQLPIKWRVKIGAGYSGPTVANGRVYVMDRQTDPEQMERVVCVDAETGVKIWTHEYKCPYVGIGYTAGPRASVTINDGLAYSMGAMGNLFCLDAKMGAVVWSNDLNAEYQIQVRDKDANRMPIWGMACSPLIYNDLVILQIGAKDASVIALDKKTGKEVWRALSDPGQYSSPVLTKQAGKDVLICWTGASIAGLAPQNGEVYWQQEFLPKNMPIGCASPVILKDRLFLTSFYDGSLMLRLLPDQTNVEQVWKIVGASERDTKALHSIISTPLMIGDYVYGVDSYGELRCLNAETGERIWEDLTAVPKARWSTIHFVQNGDQIWMFNERGELIISKLTSQGFQEIGRAKLIEPTTDQLRDRGGVCWSHPAFAMRSVFARNDNELLRADLSSK